ncbi:hypothetical protein M8818_006167 [Zalaria obscura]|uniref:Uncharacterized protein n=1 Tax=Zalaria obscura TaxID=2024903 RepID=A0ACC3S741_9PEZI
MTTVESNDRSTELFQQLDNYPWDQDQEFQGGLRAILGSASSPEQVEHLTTRAKCYYFARKQGSPVDFNGYQTWLSNRAPAAQNGVPVSDPQEPGQAIPPNEHATDQASTLGDAPAPATFAQICEMIAEGKPIPGIKDIPDTVLEGQATQSTATPRKKPWERDATPAQKPSWAT